MASDGYFRESVKNTTGAGIDNFSLSFSLGHIIFDDGYSFLEKVMLNPSYEYGVPKYYDVLNTINKVPGGKIHIYGRYWHGNVFFLKIAHIWFDLEDIRIINLILQNLLLLAVLYLICKKLNIFYALSYLMAIIFMNPVTLAYSLPYSPICYLMYIFLILILLLDKRYIDWKLFLVFGCCTSFLDLLTFPLVVLCFSLLLMINIYHQNLIQDIKKNYRLFFVLGVWIFRFMDV